MREKSDDNAKAKQRSLATAIASERARGPCESLVCNRQNKKAMFSQSNVCFKPSSMFYAFHPLKSIFLFYMLETKVNELRKKQETRQAATQQYNCR